MKKLADNLRDVVRDIPDFPIEGILFKDVTPIFKNPKLVEELVLEFKTKFQGRVDAVAGIESRGFLLGMPLAMALNVPFVLIRKKGKLPYTTIEESYGLEYGKATIEMHTDAIEPGQKILIHDDLLATGGTAEASANLIEKAGGVVEGYSFLIELKELNGRKLLEQRSSEIVSVLVE